MTDDSISRKSVIAAFQSITGMEWERLKILLPVLAVVEEVPSAGPQITLESAIDFLHSIGWMQEHDRILAESAERRGKWIMIDERTAKCSLCGAWEHTNGADRTMAGHIFKALKHYCPNCGAKMEADCSETKVYTATPKGRTILERIKAGEGLPPLGAKMEADDGKVDNTDNS